MTALVAALLLAVPAKDPGRAIARRVQAFYAQTKDFSAAFRQHYTYVAIGRVEESEGVVQVKKPGRVRWDYAKPDRRTLYIEDRTLWIWRPDDQEAQVKRNFGGEQLSSAFTFLWGKGNLLKDFSPRAVPAPEGLPKGDTLELTPIKPMPGIEKLVFVVAKDGQVLASVVTNAQGDINQIVFTGAKIDQGLSDSLFHFAPPKGAYVQEL
jgi:outer membrane lipoprotein carrier protein